MFYNHFISFLVLTYRHSAKCQLLFFNVFYIAENQYQAEGTFHSRLIPHGYAVVMVDEIMEGFEELELDY